MLYSIVIPCYKSARSIREVVEQTSKEMEKLNRTPFEFVLVDDYSPDEGETVKELRSLADDYDFVKVVELAKNAGQHNAVLAGLNVEEGDALIVFSKKSVLYCAAELQSQGIHCSVVYGALPYEARKSEVERFLNKETTVIVGTDAIGMGMNLPIRRVAFLEDEKFDGTCKRPLTGEEIRQIAGRAGRLGMYPV
ncbi:MAG: glycosyltransferase, partial [Firmicutes bacterium]|nr:glycosyltransferase [Bacillota bacterium]